MTLRAQRLRDFLDAEVDRAFFVRFRVGVAELARITEQPVARLHDILGGVRFNGRAVGLRRRRIPTSLRPQARPRL